MAVSVLTNKALYNCNDAQVLFPFTFPVLSHSDLKVYLVTKATGVATLLIESADYSIYAAGPDLTWGGNVLTEEQYTSDYQILIVRNVPLTQEMDYEEGDSFPAESHEKALDKLTMEAQQIQEQIGRQITAPITDIAPKMALPGASDRAWKFLAFDSLGDVVAAEGVLSVPAVLKEISLFGGQVGGGLAITGIGNPALAALTETDVAFIDATVENLSRYHWNGFAFELLGSWLSITGIGTPALAALSETDVAFVDATLESLRRYHWNGSAFELLGTGLSIPTMGPPALTALSETDVAFYDEDNMYLRRYHWNGSTFEVVGSGLVIPDVLSPTLATLSDTDVVLFDDGLQRYHWNGSAFEEIGSYMEYSGASYPALAALSGTDVAFVDSATEHLLRFHWNGTTFELVGSFLDITGVGIPALAALSETDVAFIDDALESLRRYRPERLETVFAPA
jgi:hypothetical protein